MSAIMPSNLNQEALSLIPLSFQGNTYQITGQEFQERLQKTGKALEKIRELGETHPESLHCLKDVYAFSSAVLHLCISRDQLEVQFEVPPIWIAIAFIVTGLFLFTFGTTGLIIPIGEMTLQAALGLMGTGLFMSGISCHVYRYLSNQPTFEQKQQQRFTQLNPLFEKIRSLPNISPILEELTALKEAGHINQEESASILETVDWIRNLPVQ
jgi:hypothetical protein